jgi:hypothetical protein
MATVSNFSSHDRQYNDGHMMHMPRFLGIRSPSRTLVIAPTLESYNRRRPFELDNIAFRIRDVDGRTLPFSAVARLHRADDYAMRLKCAANGGLVERFYSKAKVIKISPFNAWRRATGTSQLAVDWHKSQPAIGRPAVAPDLWNFVCARSYIPTHRNKSEACGPNPRRAIPGDQFRECESCVHPNREHRRAIHPPSAHPPRFS